MILEVLEGVKLANWHRRAIRKDFLSITLPASANETTPAIG